MTLTAALMSCTMLGFQHGIEWDHVAAISDFTSVQSTTRDATRCGLNYAAGHAATVGLLGGAVIALRHSVPGTVSAWMQRFVGITWVLLGAYVFSALFSGRGPVSRGQTIVAAFNHLPHGQMKEQIRPNRCYEPKSSLSPGVLHGIGAVTPTQLSMLVFTTKLGGLQTGILGLMVFATAVFISNMALTTAATSAFRISKLRPEAFRWLGTLTAAYSVWIESC